MPAPNTLANKTLSMQLANELDCAIENLAHIVTSGDTLIELNDIYDRLQRALLIHRELYDRLA